MVYIYLFLISLAGVLLNNKAKPIIFFYLIISLILISGSRYMVGVDYKNYVFMHDFIKRGDSTYFEVGYTYLVELSFFLTGGDQFVFLFMALVTVPSSLYFVYKYSRWFSLSVFSYICLPFLYLATFNQIRQFFASSLFFLALSLSKKYIKSSFAIVLVAALFHKTALLFLPFLFIIHKKLRAKSFIFIFLIYTMVVLFFSNIYELTGFSKTYIADNTKADNFQMVLIFFIAFLCYFLYFKFISSSSRIDHEFNVVSNLLLFCLIVSITPFFITSVDSGNIMRFLSYGSISLVIATSNILSDLYVRATLLSCFHNRYKVIFIIALLSYLLLLSLLYFKAIFINGVLYELIPYQFKFLIN